MRDLRDMLAEKHALSDTEAEEFLQKFFLLIGRALETERYVKVKGLGTFKLIDVESRQYLDVNTRKLAEAKGHRKVSFAPCQALKEQINKPFSHFETVELEGGNPEGEDDLPPMTDGQQTGDTGADAGEQGYGQDRKAGSEDLEELEQLMNRRQNRNRLLQQVMIVIGMIALAGIVYMMWVV